MRSRAELALLLTVACWPGLGCTRVVIAGGPPESEPGETRRAAGSGGEEKGPRSGRPAGGEPDLAIRETRHEVIGPAGAKLRYRAKAGAIVLRDDREEPIAEVFTVSYLLEGGAASRPVVFAFNGGPGSSAVWLHLGVLGPRRLAIPDAVIPPPPPHRLVDNPYGLLDVADLVFIDPVGTGFSRPLGETDAGRFHGIDGDARSVAEVIRQWLVTEQRWNSPKYLVGESYGTTRAAALANVLFDDGIMLEGIVLISAILDFSTARFELGNDLPYVLFFPTYVATAHHHGRLADPSESLTDRLARARSFALGPYAAALAKGAALEPAERAAVARGYAELTGLSAELVDRADLRISMGRFARELLRDRRVSVGRLDSRYVGAEPDGIGDQPSHDPSYAAILGPYTAAMNHYLAAELDVRQTRRYEILSGEVNRRWDWERPGRLGYPNVAEDLARVMRINPHLRVFVANGYFDLATPFFAAEYTIEQLRLPADQRARIVMAYYEAGHMMYIHPPSLEALSRGLHEFVGREVPVPAGPPERPRGRRPAR